MQQLVQFKGIFKFEKYSDNNGYSVCLYRNQSINKNVTCKGYNLPKNMNIPYVFTAVEKNHPIYGLQYDVVSYEEDTSSINIEEYLASGIIKGIGPAIAKKIYAKFGEDALKILDDNIDRLAEVKGISLKTVEKIKNEYTSKKKGRELTKYLHMYGLSATRINKVTKYFPELTVDKVKSNPYILLRVSGITYDMVDHIAMREGCAEDSKERVEAAAEYVIKMYMQSGSACMPVEEFCDALIRLLNTPTINSENIVKLTIKLIEEKKLIFRKTADGNKKYIYIPYVAKVEYSLKNEIMRIATQNKKREIKNLDALIDKYSPINLDKTQRQAVKDALTLPFSIITGGPGTGKTTILKIVDAITEYELREENIYMAPTGKAARRMAESIGKPASTIHHGLGLRGDSETDNLDFDYADECNEIDNELVVVDEAGCVDMFLFKKLFSSIQSSRVLLVGDIRQLESVKPGSVLRDIINSGVVKVNYLTSCHRQKEGSATMENILRIENGISEMKTGADFEIIECSSMDEVQNQMIHAYMKKVKEKGILNVACICPFKEHKAGVREMNIALQERLNKSKDAVKGNGYFFKVGDPVMHLVNTDTLNNGDIGIVTDIIGTGTESVLEVLYYGNYKHHYKGEDLENITLAYAITLHKAQGSEYSSVISCLTRFHSVMLKRSFPYTMFSRAVEDNCFVGDMNALRMAISNEEIDTRNTMLAHDLKKSYLNINNQWINVS